MLKFRCQHCGQRIAVPARHLGKLVTCAECGAETHPLAEQIVKSRKIDPLTTPAALKVEAPAPVTSGAPCANCNQTVGRLQATHSWEGERVCAPCYHALSAESSLGGTRRLGAGEPVVAKRVAREIPSAVGRAAPASPAALPGLGERLTRAAMVFVVGVVALYGALTLLRDIAGLIAVTAVAVLALLALYAIFRAKLNTRLRTRPAHDPGDSEAAAALVAVRSR